MENPIELDDFLQQLKRKKRRNDIGTKKIAKNEEATIVKEIKKDIDVFVTQKKNNKLQKLAQLHSKSEVLYKSLEDDYDAPTNKPKPKRVINYISKHVGEPRPKPVVTVADDIKVSREVQPSKKLPKYEDELQYPDLYYGVSSTLNILENNDGQLSSKKPIFDQKINIVGVDLPPEEQDNQKT